MLWRRHCVTRARPSFGSARSRLPSQMRRVSAIPDILTWPGEEMIRKRAAVLISGRGSNMASLIEAARDPAYPAEIVLVVSNRPDAAGLDRARTDGIETAVIDHTSFGKDREAFEHALQGVLDAHHIEIVCLAGFMRLLTPWLVRRWEGRMLNIH